MKCIIIKRKIDVLTILLLVILVIPQRMFAQGAVDPDKNLRGDSVKKVPILIPLGLMTIGTYGAIKRGFLDGYNTPVHSSLIGSSALSRRADDVFSLLPIPSVYVMDALGVKARHDFPNRSLVLLKAELLMLGTVHLVKNLGGVMRPDSSDRLSFPSGHTAQAFVAASFWHHEMGQHGVGYTIAGYATATLVASLRVFHNKHWVSDVVAGAGTGLLATEIAYRTHRFKKRKWPGISFAPYWDRFSKGIYASCQF